MPKFGVSERSRRLANLQRKTVGGRAPPSKRICSVTCPSFYEVRQEAVYTSTPSTHMEPGLISGHACPAVSRRTGIPPGSAGTNLGAALERAPPPASQASSRRGTARAEASPPDTAITSPGSSHRRVGRAPSRTPSPPVPAEGGKKDPWPSKCARELWRRGSARYPPSGTPTHPSKASFENRATLFSRHRGLRSGLPRDSESR